MAQDAEKLAGQAERLHKLKKQARVSYRQIADAVPATERQVQRWFAGESDPEPDNLKPLAAFLGTTPDFIEYGVIKQLRADTPLDALAAAERQGGGALTDRLERIEDALNEIRDWLLAAEVVRFDDADRKRTAPPSRPARRKRAA